MNYSKVVIILTGLLVLSACDQPPNMRSQRYQIVFNPSARADIFLLDTVKGKVWRLTIFNDVEGNSSTWVPMEIIDSTGEIGLNSKEYFENHEIIKAPGKSTLNL